MEGEMSESYIWDAEAILNTKFCVLLCWMKLWTSVLLYHVFICLFTLHLVCFSFSPLHPTWLSVLPK